jgi:DNA-binding NarL/FixJ family response regulator
LQEPKALRVLIAENHRDLSEVMSQLIDTEPDMHCVGQVSDASEVLSTARQSAADVLILDLTLQGGGGLPLIEELTTAMPELRVIVFSGLANSDEISREAKRLGAEAYVSKGCDIQTLFDAVRSPTRASRAADTTALRSPDPRP